ncbi:MAG: CoF synthetase [Deltaproteobacteria bacterium]|nr:CoF synthetase [Deltaproteobacteria bacterium]
MSFPIRAGFDEVAGHALSLLGDAALTSFDTYKTLFVLPPRVREWASERRASAAFLQARRLVPAYRLFLDEQRGLHPASFADIPSMDKDNYVRRYRLESTLLGGRLPVRGAVIDESSGSTGTASNWVRGPAERAATRRLIQYQAQATFGDASFVLLNAFALGPWATGMNVSMSLVDRCVLKSIGPDVHKILGTLELLGPKHRYIITGYPPFLKALVDAAKLDWSQYDVCAIVGGEGLSEPLRRALNKCFRRTISSFGASDLEINLAVESDYSMALRQLIDQQPELGRALYGDQPLPMIFQYDPLNAYIENGEDHQLLFTLNRLENLSPRIRYDLKDKGMVRTAADVDAVCRDFGVVLQRRTALPLLFHWGRKEAAVAFYGCKITPDDLQQSVLNVPDLAAVVDAWGLCLWEDDNADKRLELWLLLKAGARAPVDVDAARADLLASLAAVNQDFRESLRFQPLDRRPTVRFFDAGTGPLANQDVRIKRRYIFDQPAP